MVSANRLPGAHQLFFWKGVGPHGMSRRASAWPLNYLCRFRSGCHHSTRVLSAWLKVRCTQEKTWKQSVYLKRHLVKKSCLKSWTEHKNYVWPCSPTFCGWLHLPIFKGTGSKCLGTPELGHHWMCLALPLYMQLNSEHLTVNHSLWFCVSNLQWLSLFPV